MKVNEAVTLTERERATVVRIIGGIAERIGPVKVFGSRASGKARPSSDLDLVVYPPVTDRELYDLVEAFEESDLPIFVDVIAWDRISSDRFRAEVERHAIPLFAPDAHVA